MAQDNTNPLLTRIGILALVIAIILFVISSKISKNIYVDTIMSFLFFGGIVLATYGMTKIEIKEDKGYQKFLRTTNKILLVFIVLFLILVVIGLILQLNPSLVIIFVVLFIIFCLWSAINQWILYVKTYKYIKKVNRKLTPQKRRKQIAFLIICIILGLAFWYFIASPNPIQNSVTKDPKNMALSQSDVPSDFVPISQSQFAGTQFTGYKDDSYFRNETNKEIAIKRGFQSGYVSGFIYISPDVFSNFSGKTIGSSISLYSLNGAREALEDDKKQIGITYTQFDIPKIGDDSIGYHATEIIPEGFTITKYCTSCSNSIISKNSTNISKTYYQISFIKKNVYVWVSVGQIGTNVNLSDEVIKYANIIASRI